MKKIICDAPENALDEEYLGDYCIPIEEGTVISDGRTLDSIKQGDYIIVTYIGGIAETCPAQIHSVVSITVS